MHGLERLLGNDAETHRLLALARSVPGMQPAPAGNSPERTLKFAGAAAAVPAQAAGHGHDSEQQLLQAEDFGTALAASIGRGSSKVQLQDGGVVADLEGRITRGLETLLQEARRSTEVRRVQEAVDNDNLLLKAQRGRLEAEVEFWRSPSRNSGPMGGFTASGVRRLTDRDMVDLRNSLMGPGHAPLPPSPLHGHVHNLLEAIERSHPVARGMDSYLSTAAGSHKTVEGRALAAANELGRLLLDAERDCQALALALVSSSGGAGEQSMSPEASAAARIIASLSSGAPGRGAGRGPSASRGGAVTGAAAAAPRLEALGEQLQAENELLQRAVDRLKDKARRAGFAPPT
eukprot:TRINITY_DN113672_c0_g1_i1.p1 TRINITY_DN113672_c0_g1~~TRINITY_DN113672_c0_g1_i1.p1  ORF type:complete len:347 (-),score=71.92 TRINITY_DN113672_c0_g1_i1:17-1057(-)